MLVTWELPKILLGIWFISSLIDFLEPAKTRGWALLLDPCNFFTEDFQWTTGLVLWLWECSGRLTKKTNKVSDPKLRASAGETKSLIPWGLEIAEALLGKSNTFEKKHCPCHIAIECLLQPAVKRPLEPTRISYSRTKIPAAFCLPLWQRSWRNVLEVQTQAPPLPGAIYVNLMSAALLRIGIIEMKIWVGQWLQFQEEGVENIVCHLVFACFFPLASF